MILNWLFKINIYVKGETSAAKIPRVLIRVFL